MAEYLAALPANRRAALSVVRKATNENLPVGFEEGMQFDPAASSVSVIAFAKLASRSRKTGCSG
ncbi:MAG: hypothetical protein H0T21_06165 [Gemmatimonadaceae bacterium]|nr:hypothetical protein [Gemmatimonadaceae bacterium]